MESPSLYNASDVAHSLFYSVEKQNTNNHSSVATDSFQEDLHRHSRTVTSTENGASSSNSNSNFAHLNMNAHPNDLEYDLDHTVIDLHNIQDGRAVELLSLKVVKGNGSSEDGNGVVSQRAAVKGPGRGQDKTSNCKSKRPEELTEEDSGRDDECADGSDETSTSRLYEPPFAQSPNCIVTVSSSASTFPASAAWGDGLPSQKRVLSYDGSSGDRCSANSGRKRGASARMAYRRTGRTASLGSLVAVAHSTPVVMHTVGHALSGTTNKSHAKDKRHHHPHPSQSHSGGSGSGKNTKNTPKSGGGGGPRTPQSVGEAQGKKSAGAHRSPASNSQTSATASITDDAKANPMEHASVLPFLSQPGQVTVATRKGPLATPPTMAMAGDSRGKANALTPVQRLKREVAQQNASAGGGRGGGERPPRQTTAQYVFPSATTPQGGVRAATERSAPRLTAATAPTPKPAGRTAFHSSLLKPQDPIAPRKPLAAKNSTASSDSNGGARHPSHVAVAPPAPPAPVAGDGDGGASHGTGVDPAGESEEEYDSLVIPVPQPTRASKKATEAFGAAAKKQQGAHGGDSHAHDGRKVVVDGGEDSDGYTSPLLVNVSVNTQTGEGHPLYTSFFLGDAKADVQAAPNGSSGSRSVATTTRVASSSKAASEDTDPGTYEAFYRGFLHEDLKDGSASAAGENAVEADGDGDGDHSFLDDGSDLSMSDLGVESTSHARPTRPRTTSLNSTVPFATSTLLPHAHDRHHDHTDEDSCNLTQASRNGTRAQVEAEAAEEEEDDDDDEEALDLGAVSYESACFIRQSLAAKSKANKGPNSSGSPRRRAMDGASHDPSTAARNGGGDASSAPPPPRRSPSGVATSASPPPANAGQTGVDVSTPSYGVSIDVLLNSGWQKHLDGTKSNDMYRSLPVSPANSPANGTGRTAANHIRSENGVTDFSHVQSPDEAAGASIFQAQHEHGKAPVAAASAKALSPSFFQRAAGLAEDSFRSSMKKRGDNSEVSSSSHMRAKTNGGAVKDSPARRQTKASNGNGSRSNSSDDDDGDDDDDDDDDGPNGRNPYNSHSVRKVLKHILKNIEHRNGDGNATPSQTSATTGGNNKQKTAANNEDDERFLFGGSLMCSQFSSSRKSRQRQQPSPNYNQRVQSPSTTAKRPPRESTPPIHTAANADGNNNNNNSKGGEKPVSSGATKTREGNAEAAEEREDGGPRSLAHATVLAFPQPLTSVSPVAATDAREVSYSVLEKSPERNHRADGKEALTGASITLFAVGNNGPSSPSTKATGAEQGQRGRSTFSPELDAYADADGSSLQDYPSDDGEENPVERSQTNAGNGKDDDSSHSSGSDSDGENEANGPAATATATAIATTATATAAATATVGRGRDDGSCKSGGKRHPKSGHSSFSPGVSRNSDDSSVFFSATFAPTPTIRSSTSTAVLNTVHQREAAKSPSYRASTQRPHLARTLPFPAALLGPNTSEGEGHTSPPPFASTPSKPNNNGTVRFFRRQQLWQQHRQIQQGAALSLAAAANEADEETQRDGWVREFLSEDEDVSEDVTLNAAAEQSETEASPSSPGAFKDRWYAYIVDEIRWVDSPDLSPDERPLNDPTSQHDWFDGQQEEQLQEEQQQQEQQQQEGEERFT